MTLDPLRTELQGVLGYLNFSAGKPDPRFQKQLDTLYASLRDHDQPWQALSQTLRGELSNLHTGGASAFRDIGQAEPVLFSFDRLLPAYRTHHADLLAHQSERDLFQPGFLMRAFEAVLAQGGPWEESERIVAGAVAQLNDFVGHRPIAVLETRPRGEPYDHERVRPIPLYLRGAGVLNGPYHELITQALDILRATDANLLGDACFDLEVLDELAVDPRAYDHGHPVDKRPNYRFSEWDPHHIDNQGRFRRYVVRQLTLDGLLERVHQERGPLPVDEALREAAVVLGGTILMAAGVSGWGPGAYDSATTLATLVPRIARYREAYYAGALTRMTGAHGERLRREAEQLRQPFGGARQHFNHYLAQERAFHLQQQHLALVLAEMGSPAASRRAAALIPVTSVRLLSEIHIRLTTGRLDIEDGKLDSAAEQLAGVQPLLERSIACGALVDPWNILGFQGLFPLSSAREDSVRDTRIDQLIAVLDELFDLSARLASEAAAAGQAALVERMAAEMKRLAAWWDPFATVEVSDVRHVHGGERASSAQHVATALKNWRERGEAAADLAFWRQYLGDFTTPKAFAPVVDALLRRHDYRAALALLMTWLNQAEQIPLEDGAHSFHRLALRWMLNVVSGASQPESAALVRKFFDYLEANADELWEVPQLDLAGSGSDTDEPDDDNPYEAAYESVTYRDSTGDDVDSDVLDGGHERDFDLEHDAKRLQTRLHFLATLARLWHVAARGLADTVHTDDWLDRARRNLHGLQALTGALYGHAIPEPSESFDSLVEFDRRRVLKEQLVGDTIATCLETTLALRALQARADDVETTSTSPWSADLLRLEQALGRGERSQAKQLVHGFLESFRVEPLLFTPLAHGGHPQQILRASANQTILRGLAINLPRVGLVHETLELVRTAQEMERKQVLAGPRVTEFDRLFRFAVLAAVEAVLDSATASNTADDELLDLLEAVAEPFLAVWLEHSKTLRVSVLEMLPSEQAWSELREFIRRYGRDLFHVKFLALGNLRGMLHGGVGAYLKSLAENPDPLHPVKLIDELGGRISIGDAERLLDIILQVLVENYEEYKDYNTTSPQAGFGENLHLLFAFLRLKASYERHAWQLRPFVLVHEVLARHRPAAQGANAPRSAAVLWHAQLADVTEELADEHLHELARLEKEHGLRLRTVTDRLAERFVKPLALDRLCALVEPAMMEVDAEPEALATDPSLTLPARLNCSGPAFARFAEQLADFTESPSGVGLDVPHWLERLQHEVEHTRAKRSDIEAQMERLFQVPKIVVPLDELQIPAQDGETANE